MYKTEVLYVKPNYDDALIERNRDLVGFVLDKKTKQVKKTSIINRHALGEWFVTNRSVFPEGDFELVIGSISLIGSIAGAAVEEDENDKTKAKPDPLSYRIN